MKKRRFMNSNPTDAEKKLFQHLGLYLANEMNGTRPVNPEYVQMNGIASDGFPARIEAAVAERCVPVVTFRNFDEAILIQGNLSLDTLGMQLLLKRAEELGWNWDGSEEDMHGEIKP